MEQILNSRCAIILDEESRFDYKEFDSAIRIWTFQLKITNLLSSNLFFIHPIGRCPRGPTHSILFRTLLGTAGEQRLKRTSSRR